MEGVPGVSFKGLDELCGGVVVWNVEPETVGDGGGGALAQAERVPTDEVGALPVWIVEGVEEVGSRRAEEILYVLLEGVDLFPRWVLGNLPQYVHRGAYQILKKKIDGEKIEKRSSKGTEMKHISQDRAHYLVFDT